MAFTPDILTAIARQAFTCRTCLILTLLCFAHSQADVADSVGPSGSSSTNLELMQGLIERIARDIVDRAQIPRGDSLNLMMNRSEDGWIAQNTFVATLKASGYRVFADPESLSHLQYRLRILSADLRVRYDDMFRGSFLGSKKVKRTITAAVTCEAINIHTNEVLFSGSPVQQIVDTVTVDEVPNLELASAKSTRAALPGESFLDRILEPFVIIGASGVAIYLFFHIRS